jgi:hypothetical protein
MHRFLAAAALASWASQAVAADIPANKKTPASFKIGKLAVSDFHQRFDHDWWKVTLEKGEHYAFKVGGCGNFHAEDLQLRNKDGKIIAGSLGCWEDGQAGLEIDAPYTGAYFIDTWAALGAYQYDDPTFRPITYGISSQKGECRNNAKTKCSLIVGQERSGDLFWGWDSDWWSVQLGKGKRYS